MRIEDHIKRLTRLEFGEKYVYYNTKTMLRHRPVFTKARELYEEGRVALTQRSIGHGEYEYIATGLLSDIGRMKKGLH